MKTQLVSVIALLSTLLLALIAFTALAQNSPHLDDLLAPTTSQLEEQIAQTIALAYLDQNKEAWGLTAVDLAEAQITDTTISRLSGVATVYVGQRLGGIEVFNGLINVSISPDGEVITAGSRFVPDLAGSVHARTASVSAEQAVDATANHLGLVLQSPLKIMKQANDSAQETLFTDGGISQNPIPAKLVYDASGEQVRLAWNVIIYQLDGRHWWNVRVDANTGDVLSQNDWVADEHFAAFEGNDFPASEPVTFSPTPVPDGSSYRVYHLPVESPNHSIPPSPADGRTLQDQPADAIGSPFGWHDIDGIVGAEFTTTQGNNAHAYTDIDGNGIPDPGSSPDGGPGLDFDFPLDLTQPPSAYRPAAVTNLFHWNNLLHDVNYRYGFDEIHGNFQENNYGHGGLGSDYMNAEAQDGMGTNCGNIAVPPDGVNPRMQMCVWTLSTPHRDGDLDTGIIAHEFGHGVSNRMVGGPGNVSCLNNAEAMLEGWADWQVLIMTMENGDQGSDPRGIGTYVLNQPTTGNGLRQIPYTTDMMVNDFTYGDLPTAAIPHGVGFIWATMLWEMNWELINVHGFDEDLYPPAPPVNTWAGNQLAHALVTEGLNLVPCSPGFVDGRNAILNADIVLTGGENQCTIWTAFARRGLGFSASQGSPNNTTDGTEAFDLPPSCLLLNAPPTINNICQGDTAVYTIGVGSGFTPPVTMSAANNPAPSTATFNPNPVTAVPANTTLTISNTGSAPAGSHVIDISGGDGIVTDTTFVYLAVYAAVPGTSPVLTTPPDGSSGVSTSPSLSWNPAADATSYFVEIATDVTFTNIVYTADEATTTHQVGATLSPDTLHYWRVTAVNPCGNSQASLPFSFTTANAFCSTPNLPIPDVGQLNDTLTIPINGTIQDVDIYINAPHTWVGDLTFTISHSGTNALIIDRPGRTTTGFGCSGDNYDITVNDEGPDGDIETQCANNPAIFGDRIGGDPPNSGLLAAFDGLDVNGSWTLNVADFVSGDIGSLVEWCVIPSLEPDNWGVNLSPGQALEGAPGQAVTYTMSLTNTGGVSDTFTLAANAQWPTDLSANNVILAAGEAVTFTAVTTIPTNALAGETGTALVTATSQGDPTISDNALLTTTATAVYGVSVQADQATLSGTVGTVVTYNVQISNTGNSTDTFSLNTINDNGWTSQLSANSITLTAGDNAQLFITVHIPANAADGEMNGTTVTAVSGHDPEATGAVMLTTTATATPGKNYRIFLPAVLKVTQ